MLKLKVSWPTRLHTVGVDYFFGNGENVKPGFRVAYLQSGRKISGYKHRMSLKRSLIFVMPGVRVNYDISEKLSLNGKLFGGIAFVKFANTNARELIVLMIIIILFILILFILLIIASLQRMCL
ncbi:hypothetical protein AGMMS49592_0200 [Endomicrobiia bacterium]|nr:hypothetical protein AGMMS49592_0200 [Endomicrobiia bacterium]